MHEEHPLSTDDADSKIAREKIRKNNKLKMIYTKFMDEYLQLGHMEEVNSHDTSGYYIPHQAVIRPDSSTTRLRVVFDAPVLKYESARELKNLHY